MGAEHCMTYSLVVERSRNSLVHFVSSDMDSPRSCGRAPPTLRQEETLGTGGFATVFKAYVDDPGGFSRLRAGMYIAVKTVCYPVDPSCPKSAQEERVEREVAMLKSLQHPNIMSYYGVVQQRTSNADGTETHRMDILTEYCPGNSLRHVYKKNGALSEAVVRTYARQILLGLKYLHDRGVVHRDVKALNILLGTDGNCKVADFGSAVNIANLPDQQFHSMQGTIWWMAPEVFLLGGASGNSGASQAADVWSLGVTIWEIATGTVPFQHCGGPLPFISFVSSVGRDEDLFDRSPVISSPLVASFVRRCLRRNPSDRPSVDDLLLDTLVRDASGDVPSPQATILNRDLPFPSFLLEKVRDAIRWWDNRGYTDKVNCASLLAALGTDGDDVGGLITHQVTAAPACSVSIDDFIRFVAWFGPFDVIVNDLRKLVRQNSTYVDYTYSGRYDIEGYDYTFASDAPHSLLTWATKSWFQPLIAQQAAEERLVAQPPETFVVRCSSRFLESPGGFTVTVKGERGVNHYRVFRPSDAWSFVVTVDKNEMFFDSLDDLVTYGQLTGLKSIRSDRMYKLKYPLPVQ